LKQIKSHIAEQVADAVRGISGAGVDQSQLVDLIETPPSDEMGDLALPCFHLAKAFRKSPAAIASELAGKIVSSDIIARIEATGPYLNFFLRHDRIIADTITEIKSRGYDYGKNDIGLGKTIVIDYSSPNIAKPFGIGHLRSTVLGAALKRILQYQGYKVYGINHLGDWGTQFGKVILAFKLWGDKNKLIENPIEYLYDLYVRMHQEEEKDPTLIDKAREEFRKLEKADPDNFELWKQFSDLSRCEFDKIYDILDVNFEATAGESFYNDKNARAESLLREKGLLSESREATIVDLEPYGLQPMLVKRSDDATLYATRDLAAAVYRKETYNFHKMLYVVGVAQSLHFQQLFKVLELLDFSWAKDCHHISFGWVKLGDEMMSTRKGNIIFLEDVIAKAVELAGKIIREKSPDLPDPEKTARDVGIGAVVFTDLAFRRETDISFDWDRMLDFSGNSGPYLQYTHARICSVLRKYGKPVPETFDIALLGLPEEYAIAKKLGIFPDVIDRAAREYEPFHLSSYLLELCGLFNTYYQKYKSPDDRIISANPEKAASRIALIDCARHILRSGLTILGMKAPEMM
jgi:arginyl-tRNA synthetase